MKLNIFYEPYGVVANCPEDTRLRSGRGISVAEAVGSFIIENSDELKITIVKEKPFTQGRSS